MSDVFVGKVVLIEDGTSLLARVVDGSHLAAVDSGKVHVSDLYRDLASAAWKSDRYTVRAEIERAMVELRETRAEYVNVRRALASEGTRRWRVRS